MKKNLPKLFLALLCVIVLLPVHVFAESDYKVLVQFYPNTEIKVNDDVSLSLSLQTSEGASTQKIKAWIRLSQDNELLFSSTDLLADDGTIDFEYKFLNPGEYDLTIRLIDTLKNQDATKSFPIIVQGLGCSDDNQIEQVAGQKRSLAFITLIIGIIGGGLFVRIWGVTDKEQKKT